MTTMEDVERALSAWPRETNVRACFVHEGRDPPADQTASAAAMACVLAAWPDLSITGFGLEGGRVCPEALARQRDAMSLPGALGAFEAARSWLRSYHKQKACRISAYNLKHDAAVDIDYVTNGIFIAAALAEGFSARRRRTGSDGMLNVGKRADGRMDARPARPMRG
jgi:hypothetical protein